MTEAAPIRPNYVGNSEFGDDPNILTPEQDRTKKIAIAIGVVLLSITVGIMATHIPDLVFPGDVKGMKALLFLSRAGLMIGTGCIAYAMTPEGTKDKLMEHKWKILGALVVSIVLQEALAHGFADSLKAIYNEGWEVSPNYDLYISSSAFSVTTGIAGGIFLPRATTMINEKMKEWLEKRRAQV